MARELEDDLTNEDAADTPDAGDSGDAGDGTREETLLKRRSCLKMAQAAVVAVVGSSAVSGAASAASYETITVPEGGSKLLEVGSGETLEHTLIDISAPGADAHINAYGDDWTIRNVGFKGRADIGRIDGGFANLISAGGNGTIDTVYMGDGVQDMIAKGAVGVGKSHAGHIEFRNVYMAGWTGSAVYGAAMAEDSWGGGEGTLAFDSCYLCNNNISHLRIASDGTTVDNTVIHNTSDVPLHPVSGGVVNSRGIYTGYGDADDTVTVRNCDIRMIDSNTNGACSAAVSGDSSTWGELSTLDIRDSQVEGPVIGDNVTLSNTGSSPDIRVPAGVPETADQAASGNIPTDSTDSDATGDDSDGTTAHTLTIEGTGQTTNYEFTVDGDLTASDAGSELEPWDDISGSTANGWVTGSKHVDSFTYTGSITDFAFLEGKAAVYLNGSKVKASSLG